MARRGRTSEGKHLRRGRVSGYVGTELKARVANIVGYLGFTSESHFVEYAVEQAVELAERDVENIGKVYKTIRKEK